MKVNKLLTIFACFMIAALLYVFGSMYLTSNDQAGGGSSNANSGSGGSDQSGEGSSNTNSPGNNGASSQANVANQTANPTGAVQENFVPGAEQQSIPIPTQPVSVPRQTNTSNGTAANGIQEQSQNISVQTAQPQVTQNPMSGLQ